MKVFEYGRSTPELGSNEPNPGNETVEPAVASTIPSGTDSLTEKKRLGLRSSRHDRTMGFVSVVSVRLGPLAGGTATTSRGALQSVECRPSIVGIVSIATERRTPRRSLVTNGAALWLNGRTTGQRGEHKLVFTRSDLGDEP